MSERTAKWSAPGSLRPTLHLRGERAARDGRVHDRRVLLSMKLAALPLLQRDRGASSCSRKSEDKKLAALPSSLSILDLKFSSVQHLDIRSCSCSASSRPEHLAAPSTSSLAPSFTSAMSLLAIRLDRAFPPPQEASLPPHELLQPLLHLVDEDSAAQINRFRRLEDAQRESREGLSASTAESWIHRMLVGSPTTPLSTRQ